MILSGARGGSHTEHEDRRRGPKGAVGAVLLHQIAQIVGESTIVPEFGDCHAPIIPSSIATVSDATANESTLPAMI
jgi:hypothetical protein